MAWRGVRIFDSRSCEILTSTPQLGPKHDARFCSWNMHQKCKRDKNWRLCPTWKCSQQSVNNHLAKHNDSSLSNYWNYTLSASLVFECKVSSVCRSEVGTKKQWKHITGFPKYMTVNLKTRLLSRTPQNTTHSADTFLNNDVNVLIYRVVWVCLSLCVCVWFPSLNVSRDLAGSSVQQIGVGGVSNLPQHLLTGCLTLKSSAPPFSKRMCIKPPKLSF